MGVGLLGVQRAQATVVFSDDMESGDNGWTASGLWHLQDNPEDVSISSDFNPDLVSLPDDGSLPEAYSGSSVWWYGAEGDGTFMGDYDDTVQWDDNGGWSDDSNTGDLISPEIDLSSLDQARLSFWTWWEVEGVDVDRYDLMEVQISIDGGSVYTDLGSGQINPVNDVDGESWKPYSSGGLGQIGVWEQHVFDLSDFVGEGVMLKFTFDTVDEKYNAFRGWLLDDVQVDDEGLKRPSWKYTAQALVECVGGEEVHTPAKFFMPKDQTLEISKSKDGVAYIAAFGTANWVWDSSVNGSLNLPAGAYVLYVDFKGSKGCPHATIHANAAIKAGPQSEAINPDSVLVLNGSNFVGGASVEFKKADSGDASMTSTIGEMAVAEEVAVVSSKEIHVVVPSSLKKGIYHVTVTNPDGKTRTMKNAVEVSKVDAPEIDSIDPETVENSVTTPVTISGYYFDAVPVVVVGGVPLTDVTVDEFGTTITGNLPAGVTAGFRNVEVINSDGQTDVLVGGLEVTEADGEAYVPNGSFVGVPDQVTGISVSVTGATSADVTWTASDRALRYKVQLLDSDGEKIKTFKTTGLTRALGNTYLDSGTTYGVRVRGVNDYGKGEWSEVVEFTTE